MFVNSHQFSSTTTTSNLTANQTYGEVVAVAVTMRDIDSTVTVRLTQDLFDHHTTGIIGTNKGSNSQQAVTSGPRPAKANK